MSSSSTSKSSTPSADNSRISGSKSTTSSQRKLKLNSSTEKTSTTMRLLGERLQSHLHLKWPICVKYMKVNGKQSQFHHLGYCVRFTGMGKTLWICSAWLRGCRSALSASLSTTMRESALFSLFINLSTRSERQLNNSSVTYSIARKRYSSHIPMRPCMKTFLTTLKLSRSKQSSIRREVF